MYKYLKKISVVSQYLPQPAADIISAFNPHEFRLKRTLFPITSCDSD